MGQARSRWKELARTATSVAALAALAAVVGVIGDPSAAASARQAATAAPGATRHLVAGDADVYLDVDRMLPPSYVMSRDERTGSITSRSYVDRTGSAAVTLNVVLGRGDLTRDLGDATLDDPGPYFDDETTGALADQVGVPRDQLTARNGPWTPIDIGVRARSSTNAVDVVGEGSITYEVVQYMATWRDEVALGEVVSVHVDSGAVDPVALAREIAERVASGPPSRRARLVAAGLVRGADLPGEWQVEPVSESGTGDDTAGSDDASDDRASAEVMRDSAKRERACDRYASTIDAATATGGGAGKSFSDDTTTGPHFRSGFDQAQSSVWVSSERAARATFREMHAPAFMHCLRTLYSALVDASLDSGTLDGVSVDVHVENLPATGDDALLATVRLDVPNGRHVITEVVFLRVGAAQGVYTFTTTSDTTVRSSVLAGVVNRLEDAA